MGKRAWLHALHLRRYRALRRGGRSARRFPVNVALLHFGAAQAKRFGPVSITLTAREGTQIAALLEKALIIPIHYEGWTHLTEGREDIERAFLAAGQESHLQFLPPGQPVSFDLSRQPSPFA